MGKHKDPDYKRKWAQTPRGRFSAHKAHATARGVEFTLTFDQWWGVWQASGKWEWRGRKPGQFCMSRIGDKGGYTPGNVRIKEVRDNLKEQLESGQHKAVKLTSHQYAEIVELSKTMSQSQIALVYGVNQSTVSRVINGLRGNLSKEGISQ